MSFGKISLSVILVLATTASFAQRRPRPDAHNRARTCVKEVRLNQRFVTQPRASHTVAITGAELVEAASAAFTGTRLRNVVLNVQPDYAQIMAWKFDRETTVGVPSGAAINLNPYNRGGQRVIIDFTFANFVYEARQTYIPGPHGRRVIDANGELSLIDLNINATGNGTILGATLELSGAACNRNY